MKAVAGPPPSLFATQRLFDGRDEGVQPRRGNEQV